MAGLPVNGADRFFEYARKRYRIKLRRDAGQPAPWTADPILQRYRFCNVFREDDRTTTWFRENIRQPLRDSPHVFWATILFRWFNRVEVGKLLLSEGLAGTDGRFQPTRIKDALRTYMPTGPWVTGAYMVKTPAGADKVSGVLWCLGQIYPDVEHLVARVEPGESTLEGLCAVLQAYPYMGPFMAYEVATDLRHTALFDCAPDIRTWANPGPGAARGLGRIFHNDPNNYNRHSILHLQSMQVGMQQLLAMVETEWSVEWPPWEMREVEHTLCEFDKYERARLGEGRPKQLFKPAGATK